VPVDEAGRLYCRRHGHMVAPEYDGVLAKYERRRAVLVEVLHDAAEDGVSPTPEDVEAIRREWDAPASP
jgi:hypothetical protein